MRIYRNGAIKNGWSEQQTNSFYYFYIKIHNKLIVSTISVVTHLILLLLLLLGKECCVHIGISNIAHIGIANHSDHIGIIIVSNHINISYQLIIFCVFICSGSNIRQVFSEFISTTRILNLFSKKMDVVFICLDVQDMSALNHKNKISNTCFCNLLTLSYFVKIVTNIILNLI